MQTVSPCDWPVSYLSCDTTSPVSGLSDEDRRRVEASAGEFLWRWTGRIFGLCPVVYRPCRIEGRWVGLPYAGKMLEGGCGVCADSCGCEDELRMIKLPSPAHSVEHVWIDGEELPTDAYRLETGMLVRQDGGTWPVTQDLVMLPRMPGTWEVEYTLGLPVPEGGQLAAGVLANELAKALCRDNTCQLPQRIQQITRQGVSMTLLDGMEGLDEGRTGIWAIDSWITSVMKPALPGRVFSVDVPRKRLSRRA